MREGTDGEDQINTAATDSVSALFGVMVPEVNEKKVQGCEMYPCRLCVPTAARCHCFRLPNNSLGLGCGGWYGVGPWGPQSVSLVPQVPYLAPSGRVAEWYHHAGPSPSPPPSPYYDRSRFYSRMHQKQQRRKTRDRWQAALSKCGEVSHTYRLCLYVSLPVCQF